MGGNDFLIDVNNLKKHFPVKHGFFSTSRGGFQIKAVDGVSFQISRGKSLGIAGESGCGKSTTGKMLLRLIKPTEGKFLFDGNDVTHLKNRSQRKAFRKEAQLMFQNPYEALNPRLTISRSIEEPLIIHKVGKKDKRVALVRRALEQVKLTPTEFFTEKYPHQMSGGQLQRVVLARALVVEPTFLVADEPVSMLDVSVRAGVLNLMKELTAELRLTTIYISHDLSLIQYMCQKTAIMYLGKIVEIGSTSKVLNNPKHPYTKALIAAVPVPDPDYVGEEVRIKSYVPDPMNLPNGCNFQDRCYQANKQCKEKEPVLTEIEKDHMVACALSFS